MELHHQIRLPAELYREVDVTLASLGIETSLKSDSWLNSKKRPGFNDLVCSRGGQKSVFAVNSDSTDDRFTIMVYVNMLDDQLTNDIRTHLESRGAEWGYYS